MSNPSLRLLAFAAAASLLAGCTVTNNSAFATQDSSYSTQDLTGNWQVGISDPPYPGPYPITSFTGAISGSGQNITAVFRATGTGCVSPTQDITFSGSQLANGALTLTSTNLPNNVAAISTLAAIPQFPNQPVLFVGGLAVTGSGPCTMGGIALRGQEFSPLIGTFAGPITSTSAATSNFTAVLTQAQANSDGQFPETGTIIVTGSTCTNVLSLAGLVAGPNVTATLTPTSGPAASATLTMGPLYNGTATISVGITITGTGCNAGTFNGSLTKQ
jgi:hypothetical protein